MNRLIFKFLFLLKYLYYEKIKKIAINQIDKYKKIKNISFENSK